MSNEIKEQELKGFFKEAISKIDVSKDIDYKQDSDFPNPYLHFVYLTVNSIEVTIKGRFDSEFSSISIGVKCKGMSLYLWEDLEKFIHSELHPYIKEYESLKAKAYEIRSKQIKEKEVNEVYSFFTSKEGNYV